MGGTALRPFLKNSSALESSLKYLVMICRGKSMITNPKYNLFNLKAQAWGVNGPADKPSTVYIGDGKLEVSPPQLLGKSLSLICRLGSGILVRL